MLRIVEYYILYSSNLKCFSRQNKKTKTKKQNKNKNITKKTQNTPLLLRP